ncbi:MAG TPA: PP2C family protein-serine/threonine phosphatase [Bryobacteraceae bacterium]|nr:PP2C family protein-serine/threonine phosphatase [Bryobacteraceae bacterium]
MASTFMESGIGEYLRERLMPVEGVIPHLVGIEMYGNSIPAGTAGGDLFEYINFDQRYDIDARIRRAVQLSKEYLLPHADGAPDHNWVDDQVEWLKARPDFLPSMETAYRQARSLEQVRVAENLHDLYSTAGVLLVDAQGHGLISAKIASTVHDTFHAFMLSELDRFGKTTPELFELINLRLARSVTARNALGSETDGNARELATMLYGEVRPSGHFRFVNFGHPPPLLFSAQTGRFTDVDPDRMVQFLPLGLEVPEGHPDRKRYFSMHFRQRPADDSDVAEIALIRPGDLLFLYTDGIYDGSDKKERRALEELMRDVCRLPAKEICNAVLDRATKQDEALRANGEDDVIDDKTVFIIKANDACCA